MLKVLMLRKKLEDLKVERDKEAQTLAELQERAQSEEWAKREAYLAAAIDEASTDEEKQVVEENVEAFEKEKAEIEGEITEADGKVADLDKRIAELEGEIADLESEESAQTPTSEPEGEKKKETKKKERKREFTMNQRFRDMSMDARSAFVEREEVKSFIERVREQIGQRRDITGKELLIPTDVLSLVREEVADYSKLYKHVNVQRIAGKARQNVLGEIPEGVWTEMCGILNEATLGFTAVEIDGYKVGAYIPVCNALLEDSDINLASEIISALGKGIGKALDKAILYGTGTKMPQGIVTRLAQTAKPSDYPSTAREWKDLHTSNITSIATTKTDVALFKAIVEAVSAAKNGEGDLFFACNSTTRAKLLANSIGVNSSAAIVAGMNGSMPGIGGTIEELNFIPDNVVIGGYGARYLLGERAGTAIANSTDARFIEDQTVFKATARYDGLPVIAESFVAFAIEGGTVSATAVTFAEDKANKKDDDGE